MISSTKTYGTRQSNIRDGNGGGAIYGCRSKPGREPCIRSNNLKNGRAFEFETDGDEGGRIETKTRRRAAVHDQRDRRRDRPERGPRRRVRRGADRLPAPVGTAATEVLEPRRPDPARQLRRRPGPRRARDHRRCPTPMLHVSLEQGPGQRALLPPGQRPRPGRELLGADDQNDDALAGHDHLQHPGGRAASASRFLSRGGQRVRRHGRRASFTGTALGGLGAALRLPRERGHADCPRPLTRELRALLVAVRGARAGRPAFLLFLLGAATPTTRSRGRSSRR